MGTDRSAPSVRRATVEARAEVFGLERVEGTRSHPRYLLHPHSSDRHYLPQRHNYNPRWHRIPQLAYRIWTRRTNRSPPKRKLVAALSCDGLSTLAKAFAILLFFLTNIRQATRISYPLHYWTLTAFHSRARINLQGRLVWLRPAHSDLTEEQRIVTAHGQPQEASDTAKHDATAACAGASQEKISSVLIAFQRGPKKDQTAATRSCFFFHMRGALRRQRRGQIDYTLARGFILRASRDRGREGRREKGYVNCVSGG